STFRPPPDSTLFPYTTLFRSLLVAVLGHRLGLVQALQGAVHALVHAPRLRDGNPHLIELFERDEQRLDGALQHRRVRAIEHETRSEEHTSELQSQSNLVCRLL